MAFPTISRWMTGLVNQKTARMADGSIFGRPVATFAGGISPTTSGGAHGVVGDGDLAVTLVSGLTVRIAPGAAVINGTSTIDQGVYMTHNHANQDLTLAAHSVGARTDLVVVRARDTAEDGSGATQLDPSIVQGVSGGGVPSPLSGSLVLAQIAVPAGSGAIAITDTRPFANALGGIHKVKSTTRPTGVALSEGRRIYETDTTVSYARVGGAWVPEFDPRPWQTWTPTYTNITVGGGSTSASYKMIDPKTCMVKWQFQLGAGSAIGTDPRLTLPVAPLSHIELESTLVTYADASSSRFQGMLYSVGGPTVGMLAAVSSGAGTPVGWANVTATYPFTWTSPDRLYFSAIYETA